MLRVLDHSLINGCVVSVTATWKDKLVSQIQIQIPPSFFMLTFCTNSLGKDINPSLTPRYELNVSYCEVATILIEGKFRIQKPT